MNETYTEKLARWFNELNSWRWADDMPGKPVGFEDFPDILRDGEEFIPNKYDWIDGIMQGIIKIIGRKETLRWHHIHNIGKTNEEFEEWWTKARIG